jgi:hypothetical protein
MTTDNKKDALKDYVEVNKRIELFWQRFANGRIETEIKSWNDGVIIMVARVWKDSADQFPSATGHAYERENSSYINKTSALENCETSAVGRALAILGFEIKKSVASKEEVENAIQQQEEIKKKENKPKFINDPALKAKYNILNGSPDGFDEFIEKMFLKGYSKDAISDYLTKKVAEKKEQKSDE